LPFLQFVLIWRAPGCNVIGLDRDYITAPEFAVDRKVEQRHVAREMLDITRSTND
jgi:hypothetical protein